MKFSIFISKFDLILMMAGKLFQSWIRLENLNLVILSGLGPPKYILNTFTPFVSEGNQDSLQTYIGIVLHYHFICMSEPGQNGFLIFSYFMNNILSSGEFIVLFRVYGFLAWRYWLCTYNDYVKAPDHLGQSLCRHATFIKHHINDMIQYFIF